MPPTQHTHPVSLTHGSTVAPVHPPAEDYIRIKGAISHRRLAEKRRNKQTYTKQVSYQRCEHPPHHHHHHTPFQPSAYVLEGDDVGSKWPHSCLKLTPF